MTKHSLYAWTDGSIYNIYNSFSSSLICISYICFEIVK